MDTAKIKTSLGSVATTQNILIAVCVILVLAVGYLGWKSWKAPSAQALNILQAQDEIIQKNLDNAIKISNEKITVLEAKFKASQVNVAALTTKLKGLEVKYGKITVPKGKPETIKRFNAAGYNPR